MWFFSSPAAYLSPVFFSWLPLPTSSPPANLSHPCAWRSPASLPPSCWQHLSEPPQCFQPHILLASVALSRSHPRYLPSVRWKVWNNHHSQQTTVPPASWMHSLTAAVSSHDPGDFWFLAFPLVLLISFFSSLLGPMVFSSSEMGWASSHVLSTLSHF